MTTFRKRPVSGSPSAQDFNMMQDNVRVSAKKNNDIAISAVNNAQPQPGSIAAGQLRSDVNLTAGANTIGHTLGRPAVGVIVVKSTVNQSYKAESFTDRTATITVAANAVVSVWIF